MESDGVACRRNHCEIVSAGVVCDEESIVC